MSCKECDLSVGFVCKECSMDRIIEENTKLREALKFTIKAAEHLFKPDEPLPEGLPAIFYHTLSYKGDLELIEKTKAARKVLEE